MKTKHAIDAAIAHEGAGVTMSAMRTLDLEDDLGRLAVEVMKGETIELRLKGQVVARVEPIQTETEQKVDALVAEGKALKGSGVLPEWFLTRPLPQPPGSVLQQLLDDRKSRDW